MYLNGGTSWSPGKTYTMSNNCYMFLAPNILNSGSLPNPVKSGYYVSDWQTKSNLDATNSSGWTNIGSSILSIGAISTSTTVSYRPIWTAMPSTIPSSGIVQSCEKSELSGGGFNLKINGTVLSRTGTGPSYAMIAYVSSAGESKNCGDRFATVPGYADGTSLITKATISNATNGYQYIDIIIKNNTSSTYSSRVFYVSLYWIGAYTFKSYGMDHTVLGHIINDGTIGTTKRLYQNKLSDNRISSSASNGSSTSDCVTIAYQMPNIASNSTYTIRFAVG